VRAQLAGAGVNAFLETGQVGDEAVRQLRPTGETLDSVADLGEAGRWNQELTGG